MAERGASLGPSPAISGRMTRRVAAVVLLAACRYTGPGVTKPVDALTVSVEPAPSETGDSVAARCPAAADADADGWHAQATGGTDCDDTNAAVNPAVADTGSDGVDADCDGADGSSTIAVCTPLTETCDDTDEDCDGVVDDAFASVVTVGAAVALVASLRDDGADAWVVGAPSADATVDGAVSVYALDGTLIVRIDGAGQSPSFGQQIAAGRDLTGDGVADLVVSAPYVAATGGPGTGRVFVFEGPLSARTTLADAVFRFEGGELAGRAGAELALAPDLTGDGLPELLVGHYRHVLLFSGVSPGEGRIADAYATWEVSTGGGAWHFATAPDADDDGRDELVLGMSTYAGGAGFVGRWNSGGLGGAMGAASHVYPNGGYVGIGDKLVRVGDSLWTLAGTTPVRLGRTGPDAALSQVARGLADGGDLDGDGLNDLVIATEVGVEVPGVGAWGGSVLLQTERALRAPTDLDGDRVPDVRVLGSATATAMVAALDGARAFTQSCDGDGDGAGFDDCDDTDPNAAPYRREACDGIDNDCDGQIDSPAEAVIAGVPIGVSSLGDVDGDASAEFAIVDAAGRVTVWDGEAVPTPRAMVSGAWAGVPAAFAGVGDTNGDGRVELLVNADEGGWLGPVGESGLASEVASTLLFDGSAWRREGRVGSAGDVDGDGLADVWVAVRGVRGAYAIAVLEGPFDARQDVADPACLLTAPESWDTLTVASAPAGGHADLNGDGRDDLLVGNPRSAYGAGRVYLFAGPQSGQQSMDDAASLLLYGEPGEQLGAALATGGDLDGDGVDDALLGGVAATRLLGGGACPLLLDTRHAVGPEGLALNDLDGDGRVEAWLSDSAGRGGLGEIWRVTFGSDADVWRAGTSSEAITGGLWGVGDTDETGGGDLLYATTVGAVRVGGRCLD